MIWLLYGLLTFAIVPLLSILIDGAAALRARSIEYELSNIHIDDFTVLVPIYGNIKYLENVAYLSQYGGRVILCTTGDESREFYEQLQEIADKNGFRVFRDCPTAFAHQNTASHNHRATSGTIRDRIIRNALITVVKTEYVIPMDADTTTQQPIPRLIGELVHRELDIASIRLVLANRGESLLTKLQYHEYRLIMQMRFILPWMISGACHVANTKTLCDIMARHSLFFQGNDVEIGIIAKSRGYKVGHIPFEVQTSVPSTLMGWFRQRVAWAGGEFRLFIVNFRLVMQHPFVWMYGSVIVILLFPLRWLALLHFNASLLFAFGLYSLLVFLLYWKTRDRWLTLMPIYMLSISLIITPFCAIRYFMMAIKDNNFGIIRPGRKMRAGSGSEGSGSCDIRSAKSLG